jgi:hypothetical protein
VETANLIVAVFLVAQTGAGFVINVHIGRAIIIASMLLHVWKESSQHSRKEKSSHDGNPKFQKSFFLLMIIVVFFFQVSMIFFFFFIFFIIFLMNALRDKDQGLWKDEKDCSCHESSVPYCDYLLLREYCEYSKTMRYLNTEYS